MREDLARNEPLFYLPNKCIISTDHARVSDIGYLFDCHDALFVTNSDRDINMLIVYIMFERLKGSDSFYNPYFEMLDQNILLTCYWP